MLPGKNTKPDVAVPQNDKTLMVSRRVCGSQQKSDCFPGESVLISGLPAPKRFANDSATEFVSVIRFVSGQGTCGNHSHQRITMAFQLVTGESSREWHL